MNFYSSLYFEWKRVLERNNTLNISSDCLMFN